MTWGCVTSVIVSPLAAQLTHGALSCLIGGGQAEERLTYVPRPLAFTVARGQVTGLLGSSDCGKTTLMRVLVGVQAVAAGEVAVLGLPAGPREVKEHGDPAQRHASMMAYGPDTLVKPSPNW